MSQDTTATDPQSLRRQTQEIWDRSLYLARRLPPDAHVRGLTAARSHEGLWRACFCQGARDSCDRKVTMA